MSHLSALHAIHFASPGYLWALLLIPAVFFLRGRRGSAPALRFSSVSAPRAVGRPARTRWGRWLPLLLRALVLAGGVVALARPEVVHAHTLGEVSGVDMMLAIDVSGSMSSLDFKQNGKAEDRLDVVKSVVTDFVRQRPNDRIGMIAFAGRPYLVSPLTLDHDYLVSSLDRVKLGTIEDGTAIGSALAAATNRLRAEAAKSKVVVLLTDGVNNAGSVDPKLSAEAAKALGVKVYTIGAGVRGEAPMPVTQKDGTTKLVMTQVDIDEDALRDIARTTGGKFFRATDTDSLRDIYRSIDRLEKTTHVVKSYSTRQERFAWALIPATCLLALELGLGLTFFRRVP